MDTRAYEGSQSSPGGELCGSCWGVPLILSGCELVACPTARRIETRFYVNVLVRVKVNVPEQGIPLARGITQRAQRQPVGIGAFQAAPSIRSRC